MDKLKALDSFPKLIDEFTVKTQTGGMFSVAGFVMVLLLLSSELVQLFTREAIEDVVVDHTLHETLAIHFDVTFPKVTCSNLAIAAVDASGARLPIETHSVFKLSLDKDGHAVGHAVKEKADSGTILSQTELQKKKEEHDAKGGNHEEEEKIGKVQRRSCGSCYGIEGVQEPKKCCNTCKDVREAFEFRNWEWRSNGQDRFWQCREEKMFSKKGTAKEHDEMEHRPEKGCEVFGTMFVAKAKGSFHIGASSQVSGKDIIYVLLGLGEVHFDISHVIHGLWFGDEPPSRGHESLAKISSSTRVESTTGPLEGLETKVTQASVVQYYLQVIATDVVLQNGEKVSTNQYAATEHVRPVSRGSLPALHFFYDTPPLRLAYVEKRKTWSHFLTNFCAITGGIFTVLGLVDALVYSNQLGKLRKSLEKRKASGKLML